MTSAVIYARYSTDKQTESSIADQVRVCQDYAKAHAMTVTETFADEGISGAALGNRPGARKLMETALAGQLETVIVADLSRLSRSMADLPKMIDRLVVRDVRVIGVQRRLRLNPEGPQTAGRSPRNHWRAIPGHDQRAHLLCHGVASS